MSRPEAYTINIDGAARGNPGPAAFAYVVKRPNGTTIHNSGCLGSATNNVAEYTALVRALTYAVEAKVDDVHVKSDSELLVKQMTGIYKVKNDTLRDLYAEAKELAREIPHFKIEHVRRAENSEADRLCNEALDGAKPAKQAAPVQVSAGEQAGRQLDVEAVEYLKSIAEMWEMGKPYIPAPREVWKHLRGLMNSSDSD
jgi:ribonuclease HI